MVKDSPEKDGAEKPVAVTEKPHAEKPERPPRAERPPKVETAKIEPAKAEPPKAEAAKPEAPKVDVPKAEAPKVEPPKPEPPKVEAAKPAETPPVEPKPVEQMPPPAGPHENLGFQRRKQQAAQSAKAGTPTLDLVELKDMSIQNLNEVAKGMGIAGAAGLAQAGADLQDPADAGRKERPDLLRRRARMPARWLRLPARARVQLSARPRRRLRLALADPPFRPAHWRHHLRPDPSAQRGRALLRADQSRRHQFRTARGSAQQDLLRQPDAALSQRPPQARNRAR